MQNNISAQDQEFSIERLVIRNECHEVYLNGQPQGIAPTAHRQFDYKFLLYLGVVSLMICSIIAMATGGRGNPLWLPVFLQ